MITFKVEAMNLKNNDSDQLATCRVTMHVYNSSPIARFRNVRVVRGQDGTLLVYMPSHKLAAGRGFEDLVEIPSPQGLRDLQTEVLDAYRQVLAVEHQQGGSHAQQRA